MRWRIIAILNLIAAVLVVEVFDHSLTMVLKFFLYTEWIIVMFCVLKDPNWKPSYFVLRDRIPSLTVKELIMRIKRRSKN